MRGIYQSNKWAFWANGSEWSFLDRKRYPAERRDKCTSFVGSI